MATIRQRNKRWQVIIKRKGFPLQSKTFDLRKDAEKWARQQERLLDTGHWTNKSEAEKTTLCSLLERYKQEVSSKKRGHRAEAYRIEQLQRSEISRNPVAAITSHMVAKWRDERLKQVSPGTVLRELQLFSHVFTVAIHEWCFALNSNPVGLIRKPAPNQPRDRVLTDAQRAALVMACGQCKNPWVRPIVVFSLETAARRGETLALMWSDIDFERRVAKLNGKTGARTIPLSPTCISLLQSLPVGLDDKVFPTTVESLKQAYERAVVRAGIRNFTFHDLRHDALTRLAKLGLNILELRAISGHTSTNMLQRYVSINAEELAVKLST